MKKLKKDILDMTKAGLVTGIGSHVVVKAGGEAGGLANISKALPKVGTLVGAGVVLRSLPKIKRRKK